MKILWRPFNGKIKRVKIVKKLYSLINTAEKEKKGLYIKGSYRLEAGAILSMEQGDLAGFTTYFNSVSVKKWKRYTTLKELTLQLKGEGNFAVVMEQLLPGGNVIKLPLTMENETFSYTFEIEELAGDILGFSIKCLSEKGKITEGGWYGDFTEWEENRIGISITTFKRETYAEKTISTLRTFQKENPWLDVLVVDNGRTLTEKEEERFRLVHSRNFGGSGGFTRGMIEYVEKGIVDYVLLMDDDIVLEPSVLERTHSLFCGLKEEYKESFLAGAMLKLEDSVVQYENTACWGKIRLDSEGKNYDLTNTETLVTNEKIPGQRNRYGAWWYCAIPIHRIKAIGYPLPLFLKGDDMEYGMRNHKEVMSMNGIGVWHQAFQSKVNAVVVYYSDRNMLIMNHYAEGCGWFTFIMAILGRILKRVLMRKSGSLFFLLAALRDYNTGLTGITSIPLDVKMKLILKTFREPTTAFSGGGFG